jgi:plasmid maintenance system antidote protein VapI
MSTMLKIGGYVEFSESFGEPEHEDYGIPDAAMPPHPIHILIDEYLTPVGLPYGDLTAHLRVTTPLAVFLSRWHGEWVGYWLGLQREFEEWAKRKGLTYQEAASKAQREWEMSNLNEKES